MPTSPPASPQPRTAEIAGIQPIARWNQFQLGCTVTALV
jgi:hypothetical protein